MIEPRPTQEKLKQTIADIDAVMGAGYAKNNPTLISGVLTPDMLDVLNVTLVEAEPIRDLRDFLTGSLNVYKGFMI